KTHRTPTRRLASDAGPASAAARAAFWRSGIEIGVMLPALALILLRWQTHPIPHAMIGLAAMTLLLLAVRLVPVAWPRERPLTLAAPVVFAAVVWVEGGVAAAGALLACLLQARFWPTAGVTRREIRLEGAALALGAL